MHDEIASAIAHVAGGGSAQDAAAMLLENGAGGPLRRFRINPKTVRLFGSDWMKHYFDNSDQGPGAVSIERPLKKTVKALQKRIDKNRGRIPRDSAKKVAKAVRKQNEATIRKWLWRPLMHQIYGTKGYDDPGSHS